MSGFTKATVLFSVVTLCVSLAAAFLHAAWCGLPLAIPIGLAAGYIGAYWQKDDPSKTARIARYAGKVGLIAGIAGVVGGVLGTLLNSTTGPDVIVIGLCLALVTAGMLTLFAWLGGWSWARHEHERQTGYKPT